MPDKDNKPPDRVQLAVLGQPVAHSLSPVMHSAALQVLAQDDPRFASWTYDAIEVDASAWPAALQSFHAEGFFGLNLTLPHKVAVVPSLVKVDSTVSRVGAANTLVWQADGYSGFNTDVFGIQMALEESFAISLEGKDFWIFGAGGAARAALVAALDGGAERITVLNRGAERLLEFEQQLAVFAPEEQARVRCFPLADAPADAMPSPVIVNATSLGLKSTDPSPVPLGHLFPDALVYDTTYGAENALSRGAREAGLKYADGLSMLIWQGVRSLEIWTGMKVSGPVMRAAALEELKQRNICHE
jgi:shikimate dehydrogenase